MKDVFERTVGNIFIKRSVLLDDYIPEELIGRNDEINKVASLLSPIIIGDIPDNAIIYGKTGVGKTAVTRYVLRKLEEKLKTSVDLAAPVNIIFINCNQASTTTQVLSQICNVLAPDANLPSTGLSKYDYYKKLWKILNTSPTSITLIILDEIDKLEDDNIIYNLPRASENLIISGWIRIVGISNDFTFKERLDPRTLSSFGDRGFTFPPYDANQLREILEERAKIGFKGGVLGDGVVPLCAALAAQEHGDARKALTLLRNAGDIAAENGLDSVTEKEVRDAEERLEQDQILVAVKTLPSQQKLVLRAILSDGLHESTTDKVYTRYLALCEVTGMGALSKVRIANFISEFTMLGFTSSKNVYRGRYGRIRLIKPNVPPEKALKILDGDYS